MNDEWEQELLNMLNDVFKDTTPDERKDLLLAVKDSFNIGFDV